MATKSSTKDPISYGGGYRESDTFIPNPNDVVGTYRTDGIGASGSVEDVSPVFEVDKVKTAQEIEAALDPDNSNVSSSRVILPNLTDDNEKAREEIRTVAKGRLEKGVQIGGLTPSQREASKTGEEGLRAAQENERQQAAANSTGQPSAGQHQDGTEKAAAERVEAEKKAAAEKSEAEKKAAAKKSASSNKS